MGLLGGKHKEFPLDSSLESIKRNDTMSCYFFCSYTSNS